MTPAAPPTHGPLAGLRVVELAGIGPGPMAAMLLADLGADVVRIDRTQPGGLDLQLPPSADVHARSRRSVALDLKAAAGRDAALRLIDRADVLIEGWRPGVAERLGVGPADCHARNPRLVYGRMTGWGQTGPMASAVGHDINYLAMTGALAAIGPAGGAPVPPMNLVADYGGGAMLLAFGVVSALWERERSGRGQVVDATMLDGVGLLMGLAHGMAAAGLWRDGRRGANLLDGGAPFYATYACADGGFVAVGALEPAFFRALVDGLGLDAAWCARQYDPRAWPELRTVLADAFAARPRAHWARHFEGSDACVSPVLTMAEAREHPHAQARRAFVDVDGCAQPAPAPRFDRTPAGTSRGAPRAGEHTDAVLAEAGFGAEAIAALRAAGAAR